MTATQVFKRFLKDNGLYASYMPRLRKAYKGAVNSSLKYNGKDYFEKVIYQPLLIVIKMLKYQRSYISFR